MYYENIILCGDFNYQLDRREVKNVKSLHNLLRHFDLYDVWKYEHQSTMVYTWCYANDQPKSRIDYVFINISLCSAKLVVRKIPGTQSNGSRISDHRFLNFTFNISKTDKGPG